MRSRYVNIFFRYFPKGAWLILLAVLLLRLLAPETEPLFNLVVNFVLLYFLLKLVTIIHESGHLMAAYWAGGTPKRMILGIGHEVYRAEWRGIKVILNSVPVGGMAMALFNEQPYMRWRYAAYVSGGVMFNILVALLFYLLFGYNSSFLSGRYGVDPASAFILVNSLALINLIPFYTSYYGTKTGTDGLLLLKILFGSYKENFQNLKYGEDFLQGLELYEKREFDKAYGIYETLHEKMGEEGLSALAMMATILLKQGRGDEALKILISLEGRIDSKALKRQKGLIFNNIAWTYLLLNNIETAYVYATKAIKEIPKNKAVCGTYGSVLIERGDTDLGMQWILNTIDLKHPNDSTLTSSMFAMLGYHHQGNFKARDKHLRYVQENENLLEKDSLVIWERSRMKIKEVGVE